MFGFFFGGWGFFNSEGWGVGWRWGKLGCWFYSLSNGSVHLQSSQPIILSFLHPYCCYWQISLFTSISISIHVSFLFLRPMILKINDIHTFCSLSLYCQHTQNQILKASIETQHPNNIPDLLDSFYQLVLGHRFVKKHVHKSNPERGRRSVPGLPFLLFPCYI